MLPKDIPFGKDDTCLSIIRLLFKKSVAMLNAPSQVDSPSRVRLLWILPQILPQILAMSDAIPRVLYLKVIIGNAEISKEITFGDV